MLALVVGKDFVFCFYTSFLGLGWFEPLLLVLEFWVAFGGIRLGYVVLGDFLGRVGKLGLVWRVFLSIKRGFGEFGLVLGN